MVDFIFINQVTNLAFSGAQISKFRRTNNFSG